MIHDDLAMTDQVTAQLTHEADRLDAEVRITGSVESWLYGPDGVLKQHHLTRNLVVTAGKNYIALLLKTSGTAEMAYMAIGSDATSPGAGQTDLGTEVTTGLSGTRISNSRGNSTNTVTYTGTWAAGQATSVSPTIQEVGLFNAAGTGPASGTMLARALIGPYAKAAGDSLTVAWTITIS